MSWKIQRAKVGGEVKEKNKKRERTREVYIRETCQEKTQ